MRYPEDEFLETMIQNADMLSDMMKNFRLITDTVQGEINLHSLLKEANIRLIVPKTKGVEIVFDLAEKPWPVAGPNFAVWYFVYNVIKNAMEAMENASTQRLTLSTENVEFLDAASLRRFDPQNRFPDARPGQFLKFSVEDTGSGMPAEVLERIFEDYFSTKDSTEVSRGRGLFGAQRAIARRGGLLAIRSEVGWGTVFDVYLPRAKTVTEAESSTMPAAASSGLPDKSWESPGNEVVLIADDDENLRKKYAKILEFYNYGEVLFAGTTQETLKIARERPDLTALVMDWRMPGDTGDDLLADLLTLRPKLPILVNTGAVPDHTDRYPGVQFTPKLKGPSAVGRALRRLIKGEPVDS
jgi:two-component system cell cycle sensor histidine kinase/response regulator CckA